MLVGCRSDAPVHAPEPAATPIAALEATAPAAATHWVLARPAVHCVLPGADELLGAVDLLRAGHGPMPSEAQRRDLVAYLEQG